MSKNKQWVKPRIVLSRCLGLEACRYNGQIINDHFVEKLRDYIEVVDVCPEADIGMGTPRDPVRLIYSEEGSHLMLQPTTGLDFTEKMNHYTQTFLNDLNEVDGFILKGRSPSCGLRDVKLFAKIDGGPSIKKGAGLFAQGAKECFPGLALEEEGRLNSFPLRHHFLTKLFTLATFRELKQNPTRAKFVDFQKRYKLIFMAYNQTQMRLLGKIVGNMTNRTMEEVVADYETHLHLLFAKQPRKHSHINVLQHALGYFKKELDSDEKHHFLDLLEDYRARRIPLSALFAVINSWSARYKTTYLKEQVYFEPYPKTLVLMRDSGKGLEF